MIKRFDDKKKSETDRREMRTKNANELITKRNEKDEDRENEPQKETPRDAGRGCCTAGTVGSLAR